MRSVTPRSSAGDGGLDSGDLAQMQQVVSGVEPDHVAERLFAALRVQSDACEVLRSGALDEAQVHFSNDPKRLERLAWIRLVVSKAFGPGVLVVANQRRAILP